MPEYLASLNSGVQEGGDDLSALDNAKPEVDKKKVQYIVNRGKLLNNTKIKKKFQNGNPDILLQNKNDLKLIHEGWLKISSPQLKKTSIYPRLTLPNWSQHDIPTERNFFRVNEGFNPYANDDTEPPGPFYFFFRLSKRNMFYSIDKNSINIKGSMMFHEIKDAIPLPDFARSDQCFTIEDTQRKQWTLCAETNIKRNQWVCTIRNVLRLEDYNTCIAKLDGDGLPTIVQKILKPMIMIPIASPMCNEDFNYNELGQDWECDCREGK